MKKEELLSKVYSKKVNLLEGGRWETCAESISLWLCKVRC